MTPEKWPRQNLEEDSCNSVLSFVGDLRIGQGSRNHETLGGLADPRVEPMAGASRAHAVGATTTLTRGERANDGASSEA